MKALKFRQSLLAAIPSCFALLVSNAISATNEADHARYPMALMKAVQAFKLASPTNRYNEAVMVLKELPKCPLKYQREVGTGTFRSYDFARPSYILSSKDVVDLLGNPFVAQTNGNEVMYWYPVNTNAPRSGWLFEIHFSTNRVVLSNLVGGIP